MRIAITGATGFLGRGLAGSLVSDGHDVVALSRNPSHARKVLDPRVVTVLWSSRSSASMTDSLENIDVFVNLAGENIGSSLWTRAKRRRILESRVNAGRFITGLIGKMDRPPSVLIQGSATGYYGSRGEAALSETSDGGEGFLPEVVSAWEKSVAEVESMGVRSVIVRSGVVLSGKSGALPRIALPYRLHAGTMLGTGDQWFSWIHYDDEIAAIRFLMASDSSSGTYNLVAPYPARMRELTRCLGPTIVRLPSSVVRLLFGQMGEETILTSQRVIPRRLAAEGFRFKYEKIEDALGNIYPK